MAKISERTIDLSRALKQVITLNGGFDKLTKTFVKVERGANKMAEGIDRFNAKLRTSTIAARGLQNTFENIAETIRILKMSDLGRLVGGVGAVGGLVGSAVATASYAIPRMVEGALAAQNLAKMANTTTKNIRALEYSASLEGVNFDGQDVYSFRQAATSAEGMKSLAALNINEKDAREADATELFIEALSKSKNLLTKNGGLNFASKKLFNELGLNELLGVSPEALNAINVEELKKNFEFRRKIDPQNIGKQMEAERSLISLSAAFDDLKVSLLQHLMPAFSKITELIKAAGEEMGKYFVENKVFERFALWLENMAKIIKPEDIARLFTYTIPNAFLTTLEVILTALKGLSLGLNETINASLNWIRSEKKSLNSDRIIEEAAQNLKTSGLQSSFNVTSKSFNTSRGGIGNYTNFDYSLSKNLNDYVSKKVISEEQKDAIIGAAKKMKNDKQNIDINVSFKPKGKSIDIHLTATDKKGEVISTYAMQSATVFQKKAP